MSVAKKIPKKFLAIVVLACMGILAAGLAHWCMHSDIGVTPDSLVYLSAADRLVQGKGLTPIGYHYSPSVPSGRPLISFPPAYPLLLVSTSLFTSNSLVGAKYIHSFLFAANVFLLGLIVYISSRSIWPALCAMALFQTSFPLLSIFTMARSEPLFMMFLLSTLLGLVFFIRKPRLWLLLVCGSTAAVAVMTRYAAITVLLPLVMTILLQNVSWREHLKRALLLTGVALLPLIAWVIHNRLVAGSSAGRAFAFHLIGIVDVKIFVNSLMLLLTPYGLPNLVKVLIITIAAVVVVGASWVGLRSNTNTENCCIRFFSAVMVATYVIFLAAYNSLANPAVDLGPRVALPVYVFGMILVFSLVESENAVGKRRILLWCITLSSLVLFLANVRPAAYWMSHRHREGEGFTSRAWRDSETVKFVEALPPHTVVYSNAADACYFFTKREALRLPAKFDPTHNRVNTDFEVQMAVLREDLINSRAVVAYFDRINWRWYLPDQHELEETHKLPVVTRFADGVVYGSEPATIGSGD